MTAPTLLREELTHQVYEYTDERGELLYRVHRVMPEKKFWQDRPAGAGTWHRSLEGVRRVPFGLQRLLRAADDGAIVFVVEGEKDVETLWAHGFEATTNAQGTGWTWTAEFASHFRGIPRVVVIADNDEAGRVAARKRAEVLCSVVPDVRLLEDLPGVPEHGDVSDFLAGEGTVDALQRVAEEADRFEPSRPTDPEPVPPKKASSHADEILEYADGLIERGSLELFHDLAGDPYATVGPPDFSAIQTFPLNEKAFARQLQGAEYMQRLGRGGKRRAASSAAWKDVLGTLEAIACHEGTEHEVYLRAAALGDSVFIDLGDESGRCVVVTPAGWRLVADAPVRFRRPRRLRPLPVPERGGDVELLRNFIHVRDESFPVVLSWLVSALSGSGPYPLLVISGEQGSAKSTTARCCRQLVDPAAAPLRALPHDERDIAVACHNNHVLAFDNLSGIEPRLSDALCRIASGEGFATRTLYENNDEQVFAGARPMILTGISEAASRPDLLDRSLIVEAPMIPPENRRDERVVLAEFESARAKMFGVLLDGLAAGLAGRSSVVLERPPRMADAARLSVAAETGLGLSPGTMQGALELARESATTVALESSTLAQELLAFLRAEGPYQGTAEGLLHRLNVQLGDRRPRGWPATARGMAAELKRIAPNLRAADVPIEYLGPTGRNRHRLWSIGVEAPAELDLTL